MTLRYLSLFSLWLGPALCLYTAFLHQSFCFFSLTWATVGHSSALLMSVLRHCLQFGLESIWPGKSRHYTCAGEGHCPVCAAWGRGPASSICTRVIDTSQTLTWLWLVVLSQEQWIIANNIIATGWSHRWLTCMLFYCQIYYNFSKYNNKIVTDYSFKGQFSLSLAKKNVTSYHSLPNFWQNVKRHKTQVCTLYSILGGKKFRYRYTQRFMPIYLWSDTILIDNISQLCISSNQYHKIHCAALRGGAGAVWPLSPLKDPLSWVLTQQGHSLWHNICSYT